MSPQSAAIWPNWGIGAIGPAVRAGSTAFFAAVVEPAISNMGYITTVLKPEERDRAEPKNGAQAAATVSLDPLGGVSVAIDSVPPQGQGHRTATAQIVADHLRSRPRGHRGRGVGKKRIAGLMRAAGIVGVSRRRGVITTRRDRDARPAPDLVDRNFAADRPNQLWVADITYVPTAAGFLYLTVVLDAFSRRIVG